jgi:hypothetical protein
MKLLSKRVFAVLGAAILATACLGFGSWGFHKSSDRGANVTFASMAKFNDGDVLPAGTYRMQVPDNSQTPKVEFYKNGKLMASANAKVISETKKNDHTEVDSVTRGNAQLVKSILPHGWNEKLVFSSNAQSAAKHS